MHLPLQKENFRHPFFLYLRDGDTASHTKVHLEDEEEEGEKYDEYEEEEGGKKLSGIPFHILRGL